MSKVLDQKADQTPDDPEFNQGSKDIESAYSQDNRKARAVYWLRYVGLLVLACLFLAFIALRISSKIEKTKDVPQDNKPASADSPNFNAALAKLAPKTTATAVEATPQQQDTATSAKTPTVPAVGSSSNENGDCVPTIIRQADGSPVLDRKGSPIILDCQGAAKGAAMKQQSAFDKAPSGNAQAQPVAKPVSLFLAINDAPQSSLTLTSPSNKPVSAPVDASADKMSKANPQASNPNALAELLRQAASPTPPNSATNPLEVNRELASGITAKVVAKRIDYRSCLLPQGHQIACVLTTRIVSDVPGTAACVTAKDVYSADGKRLLIERGSEAFGTYNTLGDNLPTRLGVIWPRLTTPSGMVLELGGQGADTLGAAGLSGNYNSRWMERFGSTLLLSVFQDVTSAALNKATQPQGVNAQANTNFGIPNTSRAGEIFVEKALTKNMNIRPEITIAQGTTINIMVTRDIDFSEALGRQSSLCPL